MPRMIIDKNRQKQSEVSKTPTGISGLDQILGGGLPKGRTTLVCGSAGAGKTVLGVEFLVHGVQRCGEAGVLFTFEESAEKLRGNFLSMGIDLRSLERRRQLELQEVLVMPADLELGRFTLDGLFVRLREAIQKVKAKRVLLDSLDAVLACFENQNVARSELRRLIGWLEQQKVTAVMTGERGSNTLTRNGLEEYLADCVISLEHQVHDRISTRRLRIIKYRGTDHDTDEFPFLIKRQGMSVMPITSLQLEHITSREIISTGVASLDAMFSRKGVFRGSSILISGTAGTGKTTLSSMFANAACRRGERCLFFAFEESMHQIVRNMQSVGLELEKHIRKGLLRYEAARPTVSGLEGHLFRMQQLIEEFEPQLVVIDPITNFMAVGSLPDVKMMLMRLIDFLKQRQITALFTNLTEGGAPVEQSEVGVSSLIDTWLLLRDIEQQGERNRGLYVLKARGLSHSNQIREFIIDERGVRLVDVYIGPEGVLIGSARVGRQKQEAENRRQANGKAKHRETIANRLRVLEAELAVLRASQEAESEPIETEEGRRAELLHRQNVGF